MNFHEIMNTFSASFATNIPIPVQVYCALNLCMPWLLVSNNIQQFSDRPKSLAYVNRELPIAVNPLNKQQSTSR